MENWLHFSALSGTGDTLITITADRDTTMAGRSTTVVISGQTKSIEFPIYQAQESSVLMYKTTGSTTVEPFTSRTEYGDTAIIFDAHIISNVYEDGWGKITFDGPVTSIAGPMFPTGSPITDIVLPNTVETIRCRISWNYVFGGLPLLTGVTLSNNIKTIGVQSFGYCRRIQNITIPESTECIEGRAIDGTCSGLTSFHVPKNVSSIGGFDTSDPPYKDYSAPLQWPPISLTTISVDPDNQYYYSQNNCIIRYSDGLMIQGTHYTSDIPEGVTEIIAACCGGMATALTISSTVKKIGWFVWSGAPSRLREVYCYAPVAPSIQRNWSPFEYPPTGGTFHYPVGSDYSYWIGNGQENTFSYWEWNSVADLSPNIDYLSFNIISGGTINWQSNSNDWTGTTIEYNKNNLGWISMVATTAGTHFNVTAGDVVQFRGTNSRYASGNFNQQATFSGSTAEFDIRGNIMSLIYGNNFVGNNTLPSGNTFVRLFSCTNVRYASMLNLPATQLAFACYMEMFRDCRNLKLTPTLSATTLADRCYDSMFYGCTSLTSGPELPAKNLTWSCYREMFSGCESLSVAPALPATGLSDTCYYGMFAGCSSLTSAPTLPATVLANTCYAWMFENCTELTIAPGLNASELKTDCYRGMFNGCVKLMVVRCLADTFANGSTTLWLQDVIAHGTFYKDPNTTWTTGVSGIPEGWAVIDVT